MPSSEINTNNNFELYQEIVAAQSIDTLRAISVRMLDTADDAIRSGAGTKDVVQLISRFNNAITLRLIILLESTEGIRLPEGATYLALGSEGRGEQTLRTDQDSAIVYTDDFPPENLCNIERFATRLVDALEEIGVPRCPGNIMASNPQWRHSLTEWKQLLTRWITVPTSEHMLNFGIFQDIRPLHGNLSLGAELRDHIRYTVHNTSLFFPNMACHAARFPSPLAMFGRIRVERRGDIKGKIDIKKAGIFAITVGASLLALESGLIGGTTWDKLELLGKRKIFNAGDLKAIEEAFTYLVKLRLKWQLRELSAGGKPTNYVDPRDMTDIERNEFRHALKGVNIFLYLFRNHYLLGHISM
jgi:CBS domain-containing protein